LVFVTNRRRRRTGSRLFAIYAAASLVPVAALGLLLVHDYQVGALERGRDQGRAQAAVIAEMAVTPALSGLDLSAGLDADARTRLRTATDLSVYSGSVTHLRLRTFAGDVAFSDDDNVAGVLPATDPDAIAAKVQVETTRAITRLGFGLLALYAMLAFISWWTTRALRQHAAAHEHQALHDSLTGLPNRELFRRTVEDALARGRLGERGALVLVDLDHFKEVNDTLGHPAGDELLQIVARRLIEALRTDDTVARLGGDEFGLVLPRNGDREETVTLLSRVRRDLGSEVMLSGVALSVQASFGVCFYPDDATTLEGLLQHADAAMYQGKHGPTGVVVYEPMKVL